MEVYKEFIGKNIEFTFIIRKIGDTEYKLYELNSNDPVYLKIKEKFSDKILRFCPPRTVVTCDSNRNRLNVYLKEENDKLVIKYFNLG